METLTSLEILEQYSDSLKGHETPPVGNNNLQLNLELRDKQFNSNGFIRKFGGYERLITFRKSEIIYDGTKYFTAL